MCSSLSGQLLWTTPPGVHVLRCLVADSPAAYSRHMGVH
jgi:hypothetical protein